MEWSSVENVFSPCLCSRNGGNRVCTNFLDRLAEKPLPSQLDWLNVESYLSNLTIPLDISHGRDDFVVPHPQALQLVEWSASDVTRVFVTGLYHHTEWYLCLD